MSDRVLKFHPHSHSSHALQTRSLKARTRSKATEHKERSFVDLIWPIFRLPDSLQRPARILPLESTTVFALVCFRCVCNSISRLRSFCKRVDLECAGHSGQRYDLFTWLVFSFDWENMFRSGTTKMVPEVCTCPVHVFTLRGYCKRTEFGASDQSLYFFVFLFLSQIIL